MKSSVFHQNHKHSKNYIFFILIIFLFNLNNGYSQTSGFLGKRHIVNVDINAAPQIVYGLEEGLWGVNSRYGIQLREVWSPKLSVGISAYQFSTKVRYANQQLESGLAQIDAWAAGAQCRIYPFRRKGNAAPLGPYQQFELLFSGYALTDLDKLYFPDNHTDMGKFNDLIASYSLGVQHIAKGNIAWHLAMTTATMSRIFNTRFDARAPARDLGAARLIRHLSLTMNAGLGFVF